MSQSVLIESPIDKLNYSTNINNDKIHSVLSDNYITQGNFISIFIHDEEEDDEDDDNNFGPLYVSVNDDMFGFEYKEETPQFTKYYYKMEYEVYNNRGYLTQNNQDYTKIDYVEIKVKKGDKVDVEISNYSLVGIPNDNEEDSLEEYIFKYTEEGIYVYDGISSDNNIKYFYSKGVNILNEYEMVVEVGDLP
jgi:hypothetical protein